MALPIDPASIGALRDSIAPAKETEAPSTGADFGSMLKDLAENVVTRDAEAEHAVTDFAKGKQLDLHDTLLAMEKSDVSLKFAVSVRNKLLDAYREVMKMGS